MTYKDRQSLSFADIAVYGWKRWTFIQESNVHSLGETSLFVELTQKQHN